MSKRIEYIDIFRGIGILLMCMGHVYFGDKLDILIHAFHMPMFFFIAGFLYHPKPLSKAAVSKFKSLLIPYITFGCLFFIIHSYYFGLDFSRLLSIFTGNVTKLPVGGPSWFLTSLFFSELIYLFISTYVENNSVKNICICVISIFGCLFAKTFGFTLPYGLDAAFVGIGIYHLGYIVKQHENKILTLKIWQWLILGLVCVISIYTNGFINMRSGLYQNIPLFWINLALACIVGLNVCKQMSSVPQISFLNKYLIHLGRNGIIYLTFNQLILFFIETYLPTFAYGNRLYRLIALVIILFVNYLLTIPFTKTKLKVLFGK